MQDRQEQHIGRRVRVARIAAGLSQGELSGLVGRSAHWIEDIEAGRLGLDRYSMICALADVCDVDVVWLLGQPYCLNSTGAAAAHSFVPALRAVLRRSGLILSGHPGLVPSCPPADMERMREKATAVNRARQGAALPAAAEALPALLEELNTTLLAHSSGRERAHALQLLVDGARNARQTLNVLGYPDLAWVAAEVAAGAATELDDPICKAAVAWDRCGAMLHQGSMRETEAIVTAALTDLQPAVAEGGATALSLHGALILRNAVAAARGGQKEEAWAHLRDALEVAERLPEGFNDLEHQTVFGRANVAVHATEAGVEVDEPDKGLGFVPDVNVAATPSRERVTHYRIDEARSLWRLGRQAAAVTTLRQAAVHAPHYVYANPMARALVGDMVRIGIPSRAAALSGLVKGMTLAG
ncbi:helix-turn-helix domain-containing protein [Streptomyces lasiicapitis]|uniref:HTH cro/C1-type domain-containing protein n=1 Tax=Streptomyces lasiicapitis TaxID=1923961 RepID=A0ABQ2MW57_9ACTN|nr:helix-turn-helix transcriptional regulator [Streptomyces lasiicapitis]GGO59008.1 hypothetical protein GCM10012286_79620 [Streptomyces lasiicapitis]